MREKILRVLLVTLLVSLLSGCGNTVTDDTINQLVVERATVERIVPTKEEVSDSTTEEIVVESEVQSTEETEIVQESDTHTHVFGSQVIKEASCIEYGTEELTCECGYSFTQEIPMELHIAGDWVVVEAATYDKEGMKAQFCIGCNSVLVTEPIANVMCGHDYKIVEAVSATCIEKGVTTYKCNNCDSTYSVEQGANGHKFDETRTVEATCTRKGTVYKICKNCNHEEQTATLDLKEHEFIVNPNKEAVEGTCAEAGHNYYICSVCGDEKEETITKEHTWDNGVITKEPTCVSSGTKTYTCGNCQGTKTEEIGALEHDYVETERKGTVCEEVIIFRCSKENCGSEKQTEAISMLEHTEDEWKVEKTATCTEEGVKALYCKECNIVLDSQTIEKEAHLYTELTDYKESNCLKNGYEVYKCANCDKIIKNNILATGHTAGEEIITPATDLAEGSKKQYCTECNALLKDEIIEKLPHTHEYAEEISRQEATCNTGGYVTYKCACGDIKQETLETTEHDEGSWEVITEATCTSKGSKVRKCNSCHAELETEEIPVIEHDYREWVEDGNIRYKECSVCGDRVEEEIPEERTHSYEEISRVEAGCTEAGSVTYKCTGCEDTYTDSIEATGHIAGEWEVIVEATYTTEGTQEKHCTVCGELLETGTIPTLDLGIDSIYYVTLRDGTQEAVIGHYDREAAAEMLVLVNQYRVENGFGELTIHDGFQEAADHRGYESAHTWEHTRPSGGKASIYYGYWGENLATGSNDAELVLEAWQNSEGHNNNILYDYLGTGMGYDYTGLSCFCKRTDYGYEYYWVQVFH